MQAAQCLPGRRVSANDKKLFSTPGVLAMRLERSACSCGFNFTKSLFQLVRISAISSVALSALSDVLLKDCIFFAKEFTIL